VTLFNHNTTMLVSISQPLSKAFFQDSDAL